MELSENFLPFTEHIKIIKKFIFPDFLINTNKQLEWYCMNIYNVSPYYYRIYEADYLRQGQTLFYNICNEREYYNIEKLTFTKNSIVKQLNDHDVFKLLSKVLDKDILLIFERILFPINNNVIQLIKLQTGKDIIFPLNRNNILECASPEFCKKYHHNIFFGKQLVKYLVDKEITIISKDNNTKCKIPLNIFSTYCDFHHLITGGICEYNVSEITIPVEFSVKSGQFFLKCLMNGNIIACHDLTVDDYKGFKNLVTYLGIMIEQ